MILDEITDEYERHFPDECAGCVHFIGWDEKTNAETCKAFPKAIPVEIWQNKVSHKNPYPGDNGITFEEGRN